MLWHFFWVLTSFFAVIGLLECIVGVIDYFSYRRLRAVRRCVLRVELAGEVANAEYLVNCLSLLTDKIDVGSRKALLELADCGLAAESAAKIRACCEKNPSVLFTERKNNDTIDQKKRGEHRERRRADRRYRRRNHI